MGAFKPVHGPWRFEPSSFGGFTLCGSDRHGNQILPILAHFGNHPQRAEANARLAAAAPDLLRELQNVLSWALTERAPLRKQEIISIRDAILLATVDIKVEVPSPPIDGATDGGR